MPSDGERGLCACGAVGGEAGRLLRACGLPSTCGWGGKSLLLLLFVYHCVTCACYSGWAPGDASLDLYALLRMTCRRLDAAGLRFLSCFLHAPRILNSTSMQRYRALATAGAPHRGAFAAHAFSILALMIPSFRDAAICGGSTAGVVAAARNHRQTYGEDMASHGERHMYDSGIFLCRSTLTVVASAGRRVCGVVRACGGMGWLAYASALREDSVP